MNNRAPLWADSTHALNAVCPYFTMFPLEFPLQRLKRESKSPILLDVFCGRGTTLYAARLCGLEAYGIDASAVAVAIARAKLARTTTGHVIRFAKRLLATYRHVSTPKGAFWSNAYDRKTLSEICRIRHGLLTQRRSDESDASIMLRAVMLGALHGPTSVQQENTSYFSNQMPRTYASKPAYSVRYWRKHRLRPAYVNVLSVVKRRTMRALRYAPPQVGRPSHVVFGNSEDPTPY